MVNYGLVSAKNELVPLKSISVEVRVQDHVATVSSTLQYVNEEERPLEALFVFPLPADAAVCHFSAKIGEQEIVAEVQERQKVGLNTNQHERLICHNNFAHHHLTNKLYPAGKGGQ
ncbi:hypothetical protein QQF64_018744 [Cirrhinus molitorella]|uniref:VIT domain-containing protein n=1 Tax=Cirrhinus molitorella TaxID=172907 RepID=A0ABR3LDL6_9TELE